MSVEKLISLDNPAFKAYVFYCSVLVLKVMFMVPLTARQRAAKKVFITPEDTNLLGKGGKVKYDDPDVERVRRAHLNDLENIPIFFVATFGYLMTNPAPWLAINLMRAFTLARFVHTFVYAVVVIPQPARAISFMVGFGITAFMAVNTVMTFM